MNVQKDMLTIPTALQNHLQQNRLLHINSMLTILLSTTTTGKEFRPLKPPVEPAAVTSWTKAKRGSAIPEPVSPDGGEGKEKERKRDFLVFDSRVRETQTSEDSHIACHGG